MDRAYNKELRVIEYANYIKNQGESYVNEHSNNYLCPNPYCRFPAETVAFNEFKKDGTPYKVPPYFRYKKQHAPSCIFQKKFGLRRVFNTETGEYSWIMPYVSEILLPDSESDKSVNLSDQTVAKASYAKAVNSSSNSSSSSAGHNQRRCYISAAAIYYIQDPDQAKDKDLTILNQIGKYQGQFQEILGWNNIGFKDNKVFYKELRYTELPQIMEDKIVVYLNAIEPHSGERFQLHLNSRKWSKQHKEAIKQEVESGINISKQSYYSDKKQHAVAFFIGKQDKEERYIFHCDYAEFCYVYVGEKPLLPFNKFGTYKRVVEEQANNGVVNKELNLNKLINEHDIDESLIIQQYSKEKLESVLIEFAEQTVDNYFEELESMVDKPTTESEVQHVTNKHVTRIEDIEPEPMEYTDQAIDENFGDIHKNEKLDQFESKAKKQNPSIKKQMPISNSEQIYVNSGVEESSDTSYSDKNHELLSNSRTKKKSIFSIIKSFFS